MFQPQLAMPLMTQLKNLQRTLSINDRVEFQWTLVALKHPRSSTC